MEQIKKRAEVIVVYQIGSLGDTVVTLPCYREIVRRHPGAEVYLLTNVIRGKMVAAESVLLNMGLVVSSVQFPIPLRGIRAINQLRQDLRRLKPDMLYYLSPERSVVKLIRHYLFFKYCGIRSIAGMPWTSSLRDPLEVEPGRLWESEGSRLLRTIGAQRTAQVPRDEDRSLALTMAERAIARAFTANLGEFIAISSGGKVPINNWGDKNWAKLLSQLSRVRPDLGLVLVGSQDEWERNELLGKSWCGAKANACGKLSPRETASMLEMATLFVGHDTGTLHLAAAVQTPVVGIYSGRHMPGKWFSHRPGDRSIYHMTECSNCESTKLTDCAFRQKCMTSITPEIVLQAVLQSLDAKVLETPVTGGRGSTH